MISRLTTGGFIYRYLLGLLVLSVLIGATSVIPDYNTRSLLNGLTTLVGWLLIIVLLIVDVNNKVKMKRLLQNRNVKIKSILEQSGLELNETAVKSGPKSDILAAVLKRSSLEHDGISNSASGNKWTYTEHKFTRYTELKSSRFRSGIYYCAVIEIDLPRELPQIIFDSAKLKGKQMQLSFDVNQKISLEGDFDKYFDTYLPAHYEIDLLSIITPEVMEALINLQDYDIEIKDDKLYIISSLEDSEYVPELIKLGLKLETKLMNNIDTYSDERLSEYSNKEVHAVGKTIQRNFIIPAIGSFFFGTGLLVVSVLSLVSGVFEDEFHLEYFFMPLNIFFSLWLMFLTPYSLIKRGLKQRKTRKNKSR